MKIRCGSCGHSFDVPDGYPVGEKIKCPECKKSLNTEPLKKTEPPKVIDPPKQESQIPVPQPPVTQTPVIVDQSPVSQDEIFPVVVVVSVMITIISGLIILAETSAERPDFPALFILSVLFSVSIFLICIAIVRWVFKINMMIGLFMKIHQELVKIRESQKNNSDQKGEPL